MVWMLPPIVVLFWLTAYRTVMGFPAFWPARCMDLELWSLVPFAPLTAGAAAWTGSRDGRRRITDLLTVTARPPPGTPGSNLTWPRCGPAAPLWRSCHDGRLAA